MTDASWIKETPVAHRGFHDQNKLVWENTLSAAARAIDAGFAIECDLQYTTDSVPVVFHDDDMQRLCNMTGDVRARTSAELKMMSVGGTADKVPTLRQLLDLVKGQVPLVIELKGRLGDDEGFVEDVLEVLTGYQGKVALMSFDHHLLKELKANDCPYPVGLTAEGAKPENFFVHDEAMQLGLDFISYCVAHLPNSFVEAQRQKNIPVITWTVRDEIMRAHTYTYADQMTFEGFDPRDTVAS
ncbi:glycerophosphodiester phosphodiesterase [Agrobacterium vitis]|uniref:glycerophosphodiester phosphodiesterase n=1 Tax=Agrobacterium vitis TaxID=373 RepID=UPI000872F47A|nr:glycerophosphodiester phosphodiesterase [Agrobacterium vitis]MCE6073514.1 glycerophosphodiester phosphodiesterase [Agrobacterium vitis]MCM2469445.1 glycerophosphodiester phosphodiesterase [Agrobacterium vitis]MUO69082.1 glycerophosphodiester phosphodiesterase [Agrobacterium vitis]MUO83632.1 glycerophosphodiester phosphodiesterase [Agrobacterium vitis]MVA33844.1 glycerophosphodiester phosphodiesterase [Agrobacterium vitis]